MNLFSWVMFGLVTGVVANLIDPDPSEGGLLGAVILGILGAVLGGLLGSLVLGLEVTGFNFSSFAMGVVGAVVILMAQKIFSKEEFKHEKPRT